MRFRVILNRDGGTLRGRDVERFGEQVRATLEDFGHEVTIVTISGGELDEALGEAASGEADVVMVGGGDGTVSAAAAQLAHGDKALAVLPAGTMNLFARTLGVPPDIDAAVAALGAGTVGAVDVAVADGRIFVHQFSVGLHAKLIRLRQKKSFGSRLGKMRASIVAGLSALFRPPRLEAALDIDGRELTVRTAGIGITNNLFGEGQMLPYAARPDGGVLGVYVTRARRRRDLARLLLSVLLGRWRRNAHVDIYQARQVTLRLVAHHRRFGCVIDGELAPLSAVTRLSIMPGALKVLRPAGADSGAEPVR